MDYYASQQAASSPYLTNRDGTAPRTRLPSPPLPENWRLHPYALADATAAGESGLEEGLMQMTLQPDAGMDASTGPYPERPGQPDCVYYMRTGTCGYGINCRFNHPPSNKLQAATSARNKEELPERIGQPECQYYLKTGTCKFGATCKYHHPQEKAGSASGQVQLNFLGLPLRPGEKDCAYYLRTGSCKFGVTCKYHHPQPAAVGTLMPLPGSPVYSSSSPATPVPVPYQAGLPSWPVARAPYMPDSRLPGPSSYMPVIVSPLQALSMPGWNTYQGPISPMPSPDGRQQAFSRGFIYGSTQQQADPAAGGTHGSVGHPAGAGSSTMQPQVGQRDTAFPERPGQPDCHHYMKTGDCKFGASCRYHHPKDRATSTLHCALSLIGLPLRPGQPPCTFYTKYGICKFGPTCKFDHPDSGLAYGSSAASLFDIPVPPYPSESSSTFIAPVSSSARPPEASKVEELISAPEKHTSQALANGDSEQIASPAASQDSAAIMESQQA